MARVSRPLFISYLVPSMLALFQKLSNSGAHLPPEAGARHERRLEGGQVQCLETAASAWFCVDAATSS